MMEAQELPTDAGRMLAESLAERGYLRVPRAADLAPGHFRARRLHPGRVIVEWLDHRAHVSPRRPIEPEQARKALESKRAPTPRAPRVTRADWKPEHLVGSRVRFTHGPSAGLCGEVMTVPGPPSSDSRDKFGYRVRIDGRPTSRAVACAKWLESLLEGDGAFLVPEDDR
jgi:hypothetical protein